MRFLEFSGEWKTVKIGTITTKVGSGVTPRGGETVYRSQGHPFVRSQNVGWGRLLLNDIAYIDEETHKKQLNTALELNDILLNITGASIGRCAVVNKMIVNGNVNQHVCIIRSNEAVDPEFLCNYLLSNYGQKQIDSFQAGGNRQGLNFEQIKSIRISIPTLDEQKYIAKLLFAINQRIETQNKIIEKLQSLIKGIAVQFTQSGTPNVRLCDCLECHSSTLQENCVSATGSYPVYGATGLIGYADSYTHNGESILIVKDGSGVGSLSYVNDHFSVIGTLNYLTPKEKYSSLYLYYALMAFNFTPYITGMAIPHIYFKDYGKAKLFCPSIEKQIRIASLLHNIEQKLVVEQNLIISLNAQKSYLLRMLFI